MSISNLNHLPNGDVIITMSSAEKNKVESIFEKVKKFSSEHQIEIGIVEMAAGADCITFGVQSGAIQMGQNLVALATGKADSLASTIGNIGGGCGLIAGALIGGIGIASGGTAIGIPAAVVCCMGAGWIFGSSGYTATKIIQKFIGDLHVDLGTMLAGGSLLAIGTYLMLDGAWRCIPESVKQKIKDKIKRSLSMIANGVIYLAQTTWKIIADTVQKMVDLYASALKILENTVLKKTLITIGGTATTTAAGVGGGVLGGSIAASSVTVLGSHALGGIALSLGLISAPLWPVIVLGTGGALAGGGAFLAIRKLFSTKPKDDELLAMQLTLIQTSTHK